MPDDPMHARDDGHAPELVGIAPASAPASNFVPQRSRRWWLIVAALIAACAGPPPPAAETESAPRELQLPGDFVDRVWRVAASSGVAPGTLYAFLSDGTLVITSPNSKPAFGAWTYAVGKLTMIEESIPYPTDILSLSADAFTIRSHNPGEPVEIRLELASRP